MRRRLRLVEKHVSSLMASNMDDYVDFQAQDVIDDKKSSVKDYVLVTDGVKVSFLQYTQEHFI